MIAPSLALVLYGILLLDLPSVALCRAGGAGIGEDDLDKVIEDLAKTVAESQVVKSTKFEPPFHFAEQFGVYPSYIRINFYGNEEEVLLRHVVAVFDSNAFVTLWVTTMLLEAARQPGGPQPSYQQLYYALEAVSEYHDRNYALDDSILVFWPEVYNETAKFWYCGPENLKYFVDGGLAVLNALHKLLDDLGLGKLWNKVEGLYDMLKTGLDAFHIPADFDDTFVNIGLGSLLHSAPDNSSTLYSVWQRNNSNFVAAMKALVQYAYRPLSEDVDSSLIDPRTYFFMRDYLYSRVANASTAAFVSTWAQNLTQDREDFYKGYRMPFNTNNVDLTVSTNVIYGITAAVLANLSDPDSWFDADLQTVYENTTDLIGWMIQHNFSSRPDLALTYYPSVYNFYWFTSRTVNLLSSTSTLPYPVLARVRDKLTSALREGATDALLEQVTVEGGVAYWDDFLGDNDTDIFGKVEKHGEDRICTTSMALNTLLYSWTVDGVFIPETPAAVVDVVSRASQWLVQNVLSDKYKPYSITFSGSVKSFDDLPFFYPANYVRNLNGSLIPPGSNSSDSQTVVGMLGIVPEAEYNAMIKEKHFGVNTPMDFHGYNAAGSGQLIFWSSEPFTYASSLLALTQYRNLLKSGQIVLRRPA